MQKQAVDVTDDNAVPAIVVSTHTAGLAVIRGLARMGVPVSAMHYSKGDMAHFSRYVTHRVLSPHPEEDPDGFMEVLVGHCRELGKVVIFPTGDAPLKIIAQRKADLPPESIAACPDWPVVERVIDKHHTYNLAADLGIPAPKSYAVDTPEEVIARAGEIAFPVVLKPRESHVYAAAFGKKMFLATNESDLMSEFKKCEDEGIGMLAQEFIPGDETRGVNYNAYRTDEGTMVEFTSAKIRLAVPDFGAPCVVVSRHIPELAEPANRLLDGLGYRGFACTEFKKDERDGVYKLMEVNARHNRSAMLAIRCGLNFPYIEYDHLVNGHTACATSYDEGR